MTNYTIIDFKEDLGQIIVRFSEEMSPLAIEVPIENGNYIVGEALDSYIKGFIPTWHLERITAVKAGVPNAAEIQALVVPEPVVVVEQPIQVVPQQQESLESDIAFITELVNDILAAKGL